MRGMGASRSKLYADNSSSLNMNDSDTQAVQRTVQMKKTKYNSMERDPTQEQSAISPIMMKKKANVHLQPMSHKKAPMMPPGGRLGPLGNNDSAAGLA
jgi:hypothetical protein